MNVTHPVKITSKLKENSALLELKIKSKTGAQLSKAKQKTFSQSPKKKFNPKNITQTKKS